MNGKCCMSGTVPVKLCHKVVGNFTWRKVSLPTNLPPQYFEEEKRYRLAKTPKEKIEALETMYAIVPKHKGTDKLRADLRKRISKFKEETKKKPSTSRKVDLYKVEKEGAAQVVLVGLPNVGKSQIVDSLTNADPEIAAYPFTTRIPLSGMMKYENIRIQLVDTPPLIGDSSDSWINTVIKNADALLLVVDLSDDPKGELEILLEELKHWKIKPRTFGEKDASDKGMVVKKALIIGNKNDLEVTPETYEKLKNGYGANYSLLFLSAQEKNDCEQLKQKIYEILDIIRVYTKPPGKEPNLDQPFVLKKGETVMDLASHIHKEFVNKFTFARIWSSGKYKGQRVSRDYMVEDGDIIELHV